jgi:hypothetical protein
MRKRRRVLVGLAAVALAALALPASTAGAGTAPETSRCDGGGASNGLVADGSLPEMARGEGNFPREPELNVSYQELPADAVGKGKNWDGAVVVPVWFHVVHDNGLGNVSDADVDRQIRIMNLGFSGFYGGYDQGFRFQLAGITRTNNAEWFYAGPTTSGEREMKRTLQRGDAGTLNYYSTTAGPYLGWAYFPGLSPGQAYLDGIVVDWESMPRASRRYADQYDLGHTATHEAGHWFNLHHVFNGGCNNWGDYVDDTPPQRIATFGCPEGQDSCRQPGLDSIHNYMDYSFDSCYNQFTAGQVVRMQDAWVAFRA